MKRYKKTKNEQLWPNAMNVHMAESDIETILLIVALNKFVSITSEC